MVKRASPRLLAAAGVLAVIGIGGALSLFERGGAPAAQYRLARVDSGPIVAAVSATGTLNAVVTVLVGSQQSGRIRELFADFNSQVRAGDVIARLDDDQVQARLLQARADLESARAQLLRAQADLDTARATVANRRAEISRADAQSREADRDNLRRRELAQRGVASTAEAERAQSTMDAARAGLAAARAQEAAAQAGIAASQAQYRAAEAAVAQREAMVRQMEVEVAQHTILSPIDGVVIQRNIDLGQTVAASLQAPTLFTIAQDLRQMEVWATVDEGDIGRILVGQPVEFTVSAFPGESFRGEVKQIRLSPQVVQNVVTYVVVIGTENPDMRLLPGMTATVRIVTARRDNAVRAPNAALRFRPAGAAAAGGGPAAGSGGAAGQGGPQGGEAMLRTLTEQLSLSEEQQGQVRAVFAEMRPQFQAIGQLPPDQRRNRAQVVRQQAEERIGQFLTPEQRTRLAAVRAGRGVRVTQGQLWIVGPEGRPQAVPVRIGVGDGSVTEIVEGIAPGQEVIVGGSGTATSTPRPSGPRFGF